MAASEGKIGFGTTLGIGDGASPEVFTTIGEIFSPIKVGETKPLVDFTHHQSPNAFREFKVGIAEGDEVALQCNWVVSETGQEAARTAFDGGEPVNFEVVAPDSDETVTFPGIVTHHDVDRPLDNKQVFNLTVKIAGPLTYA